MYLFLKHSEGYVLCCAAIQYRFQKRKRKIREKKDEGTIFVREGDDENGGDFHEFPFSVRIKLR
jgi:hypothetical protein